VLRDQLLYDLENLNSAGGAAVWARRILPAKKTLHQADAWQVEEAFAAKLTAINDPSNNASIGDRHSESQAQPTTGDVAPASSVATGHGLEAVDKSELAHPEPRRVRDKDHLRFVSTQPCLICGRSPADPHHLRFAKSRGERLATSGSSRSVEAIIARFIATVMNTTGGEKSALTRTLPHEVCGYNLILRIRGSESI
jgi:hypothetical protein